MSKEISVTQAGSILSQETNEQPTAIAADETYELASIEVGSSEPGGKGYVTLVLVSSDGHRVAWALAPQALPDIVSLIQGWIDRDR